MGSPTPFPDYEELACQQAEEHENSIEALISQQVDTVALFWRSKPHYVASRPVKRCRIRGQSNCFVPRTLFKVGRGLLKDVASLEEGDKVLSVNGHDLEVVHLHRLPPQKQTIVELRTRAVSASFSACHRIVMGDGRIRRAGQLQAGESVYVGSQAALLTKVRQHVAHTELFEVGFTPDDPVETFVTFRWGLVTKGHDAGARGRLDERMGLNAGSDNTDMLSIPDTEYSYMHGQA